MTTIGFFTPVAYLGYTTCSENVLEAADDYFYLGGRKAHLLHGSGRDVILGDEETSWILTALKIVSYCTIVIPLIFLLIKAILRSCHTFNLNATQFPTSDINGEPIDRLTSSLGGSRLQHEPIRVTGGEITDLFQTGEIGNIDLQHLATLMHRQGMSLGDIQERLSSFEEELRHYTFEMPEQTDSNGETSSLLMYERLCMELAPRTYQAQAEDASTDIRSVRNSRYAAAKDPYDLFLNALHAAREEMGLIGMPFNPSHFMIIREDENIFRLMVMNLLLQADIATDDCAGPYVKFNDHLSARYQKPMIIFTPGMNNTWTPQVRYKKDLFSSTTVGCDPEGARRLLKIIEERNQVGQFRDYLLDREGSPDETMLDLFQLIDRMAVQIKQRYGSKIAQMYFSEITEPTDIQEADYETYTCAAQTPFQLISKSMCWAAQQFASQGLLNETDLYGGASYNYLRTLICRTAVIEMLKNASLVDDYHLRLASEIELELGKFYVHVPSQNNPQQLVAALRFIPHELGGIGTETDLATDPIKAVNLIKQLSDSDLELAELYLVASSLKGLYTSKGLDAPPEALVSLDSLSEEKRQLIQELYSEISSIDQYVADKFFNLLCPDILNTIVIPEDAIPSIENDDRDVENQEQPVYRDVLWEYLPEECHELITIKNRPIRTVGTPIKVQWDQYPSRKDALFAQNIIAFSAGGGGGCMFKALAAEVFGDTPGRNFLHFEGILRSAAADYMLAHSDEFLHMLPEFYSFLPQGAKETDRDFQIRRDTYPLRTLHRYCENIRQNNSGFAFENGSALELEVISLILGCPIHIFDVSSPMKIGTEGIEEGVIQPNVVIGGSFAGAPIRLYYIGHYEAIRLKTSFNDPPFLSIK